MQEKSGPGGKSPAAVGGGPVRAGQAALWLPNKTLPGHVGASTAADLHLLAHATPWAHLYLNAHLFGQPPQLGHHLALCLAWTGWFEKAFQIWRFVTLSSLFVMLNLWKVELWSSLKLAVSLGLFFLPQAVWVLVDWSAMVYETGFPIKPIVVVFFPGTVSLHPSANYAFNGRVVHEGGAVWPGQAVSHPRCGPGLEGLSMQSYKVWFLFVFCFLTLSSAVNFKCGFNDH